LLREITGKGFGHKKQTSRNLYAITYILIPI